MSTQLERGAARPVLEDVGPGVEWFSVGLRVLIGWVFLSAGLGKLLGGFTAQGYLANVDPASPLSGVYGAMAASPTVIAVVDVAVPVGQVMIGLGLITGTLLRLAAFFGAVQATAFYFGNWDMSGAYEVLMGFVTSELIYVAVFLAVAAMAAGRTYGLDAYIERYEVDGEPLVERYPRLRYVLG